MVVHDLVGMIARSDQPEGIITISLRNWLEGR
jgi:hypothetical protein